MLCLSETSQKPSSIMPMIARSAGKMSLPTQFVLPSWPSKRKIAYKTSRILMSPKWRKSNNSSNRSKTTTSRSRNFWGPVTSVVTSALLDSATIKKKSTTQKKIFHSIWLMKNRQVLRWKTSVSLWLHVDRFLSLFSLWKYSHKFGFNYKGMKFQFKLICLIVSRTVPCLRKMRVGTPSFPSPKTQNARSSCLAQGDKSIWVPLSKNKRINIPLQTIFRKRRNSLELKARLQSAIKFWGKVPLESKSHLRFHRRLWKSWQIRRRSFQFLKDRSNPRG